MAAEGTTSGPSIASAATPQNIGIMERPASVNPVYRNSFRPVSGLSEASALDVAGCQRADVATVAIKDPDDEHRPETFLHERIYARLTKPL